MVSGPRGQGGRDPRPNAMDNYYGFGRGLDVRNPGDFALQRAQSYPSNRQPLLNQPPMEGPPQSQQRPHVNPRMRGMGGGGGGLESLQSKVNLQEIMDRMPWMNPYRIIKGLESHGVEYAENERNWDSMPDLADWKQGIGPGARKPIQTIPIFPGTFGDSLEGLINDQTLGNQWAETAYNVGDTYPLEGKGGYGTRGPFTIAPHDIQELETIPLDMQFDQWGKPIGSDDYGYFDDTFAARGGLMSLRR